MQNFNFFKLCFRIDGTAVEFVCNFRNLALSQI